MSTDGFFRARLDPMIDLAHPLAVLAQRMPWGRIERAPAPAFARRDRVGEAVAGNEPFGPRLEVTGVGVSAAGRPRLPIRLMAALRYLKRAFTISRTKNWWPAAWAMPRIRCSARLAATRAG